MAASPERSRDGSAPRSGRAAQAVTQTPHWDFCKGTVRGDGGTPWEPVAQLSAWFPEELQTLTWEAQSFKNHKCIPIKIFISLGEKRLIRFRTISI